MSDRDITEKYLEAYNDVFADIVNVLLFNGQREVCPDHFTSLSDLHVIWRIFGINCRTGCTDCSTYDRDRKSVV